MFSLLNGPLQLTDEDDIRFVRNRVLEHMQKVLHVATERTSAGKTQTQSWKVDQLRFVECMVLDTVKPLYFKVNECMNRYELDGRKSDNIPDDFYGVITREFNNEAFTPYSWPLPELHDDFAEAMPLPFSSDYTMTPEKVKLLIANMKP
jgi:hypothetical protein